MIEPADEIWYANLATMRAGTLLGAVENGALAIAHTQIVWTGPSDAILPTLIGPATALYDRPNCWITPALIDCHIHLVFAGNRAAEFEARLGGGSYETVARQGGGILSTVAATRACPWLSPPTATRAPRHYARC